LDSWKLTLSNSDFIVEAVFLAVPAADAIPPSKEAVPAVKEILSAAIDIGSSFVADSQPL
jgi:hypothetical protein